MTVEPFDTETIAELHARQGRVSEAAAIYRRLCAAAPDSTTRSRRRQRLGELESQQAEEAAGAAPVPLTVPGVTAGSHAGRVHVAWALPQGLASPILEVVLVLRGPAGVETVREMIQLAAAEGRIEFPADALKSALAAVGTMADGRFLPLARTRHDPACSGP